MFRKVAIPALINPPEKLVKYFNHVKDNTVIPVKINQIQVHDRDASSKLSVLYNAIIRGEVRHDIFSDPNCEFYLYHLIGTRRLDPDLGMMTQMYLMALMQFTTDQQLAKEEESSSLKRASNVEVMSLIHEGKLTEVGRVYYNGMRQRCRTFDLPIIGESAFIEMLLDSPSNFERSVICIPTSIKASSHRTDNDPVELLIGTIYDNSPVLITVELNHVAYLCLPSISLTKKIYNYYGECPDFIYMLGRISQMTLGLYHELDEIPLQFYSPHIKSRVLKVHGYEAGPLPALIHDLYGHAFWMSICRRANRMALHQELIPALRAFAIQKSNDEPLSIIIKNILSRLNDYDLSGLVRAAKLNFFEAHIKNSFFIKTRVRNGMNHALNTSPNVFNDINSDWSQILFMLAQCAARVNANRIFKDIVTLIINQRLFAFPKDVEAMKSILNQSGWRDPVKFTFIRYKEGMFKPAASASHTNEDVKDIKPQFRFLG